MSILTIVVEGNPIPKQSFRYVSGKRSYQSASVKRWESQVAWAAKEAMFVQGKDMLRGRLKIWLEFYRKDERRVDIDNLAKGVLDGLKGVVFEDDCQIYNIQAWKRLNHRCRVEITIQELEGEA